MNKIKIVITLALVLLVGVFAGALGTRIYLRHQTEGSHATRSRTSEERVTQIMGRLTKDLKLDAVQRAEIEKVVLKTDGKVTAVKVSYQPELKKIYDLGFEAIKERLNEEQKAKLRARHERFSQRYNALYFRSLRAAQRGIPDADALKDRLGLDTAQHARVATILADQKNRQGFIIARYEKAENPDLFAVNSDLEEVRRSVWKQLAEALTPEQLARYGEER